MHQKRRRIYGRHLFPKKRKKNREARSRKKAARPIAKAIAARNWALNGNAEEGDVAPEYREFLNHLLEPEPQQDFLSNLARITEEQFGGSVERPFTTALYIARRPC